LIKKYTLATAECSWVDWKHTCEQRGASRDWTVCWYYTGTRTEPTSWTWRSEIFICFIFFEITRKLHSQLC